MNVDDAIRGLRDSMPGTPNGLADRIITSAISGGAPSRGRPRISGRGVLITASVVIAAGVLILFRLLVGGDVRPNPEPATPAIPPARVDWGQTAIVRLTPDPGISMEEMRERFTKALAFRTHDFGGAGVEVLSADGDTVVVRLPGAATRDQIDAYLRFDRLVMLDNRSSVIASGANVEALRPYLEHEDLGPGAHYYVQSEMSTGEWGDLTRFDTQDDAEAGRAELAAHGRTAMLAAPEGMAVVAGDWGREVTLIRPTQVVPASAVQSARQDGDTVIVTFEERVRSETGRPVRVFIDSTGRGTYDGNIQTAATGTITPAGELRLSAGYIWPASISRPDPGGHVAVVSSEPYGRQPPEETDALPAGRPARSPVVRDGLSGQAHWVRLASGRFDGVDYELSGAVYRGSIVALYAPRITGPQDEGSLTTGAPGESGQSVCPVGIGTPDVTYCGGSNDPQGPTNGRYHTTSIDYGRVRPGVARIEARLGGVVRDAVIKNGWWFIRISADVPVRDLLAPTGEASPVSLTAWDADGHRVPVSPPRRIRS